MSDSPPVNSVEEDSGPAREEIASAAEVLQAMLKTSKAFRIYLPNNPLRQKFLDESTIKTTGHLARYGQLQLDVEQFSILYGGTRIYENRDPKESIAFRMYSDGIRSIIFAEGILPDEICDFIDIVGQDRMADVDEDIVTLLWMKDLPHVSCFLAEDFLEFDGEQGVLPVASSQQEGIQKVYDIPPEPSTNQVPRNIQPITKDEASTLRKETAVLEKANPLQEVLAILASILAGERDLGIFREFLEIVENLISNLLHAGKTGDALRLIRFLRKMEASEGVAAGKRELIRTCSGENIAPDAILALQKHIDGSDDLSPEDLTDLFRHFGRRHLDTTCELLGNIQKMKMRKAAISALVETGKDSPRAFHPWLRDQRWYLVRNIVLILSLIGDWESLEAVLPLSDHPDLRVRKEVFAYLQKHPEQQARAAMMIFLHDESAPLRIRALQILSAVKFGPALKAVEAMISGKDFSEKPFQEKCALYEALGELGGENVVPRLQGMITKRYWFSRSKQKEALACAVAGLKKVRTPAGIEALRKAQALGKGSELEATLSRALKEMETSEVSFTSGGENE